MVRALVGAILGIVLTMALFECALIMLSSLSDAGIIIQGLDLGPGATIAAFLILLVIGVSVQASRPGRGEPRRSLRTGT